MRRKRKNPVVKEKQPQSLAWAEWTCMKGALSVPPPWASRVSHRMEVERQEQIESPQPSVLPAGKGSAAVSQIILMLKEECRVKWGSSILLYFYALYSKLHVHFYNFAKLYDCCMWLKLKKSHLCGTLHYSAFCLVLLICLCTYRSSAWNSLSLFFFFFFCCFAFCLINHHSSSLWA